MQRTISWNNIVKINFASLKWNNHKILSEKQISLIISQSNSLKFTEEHVDNLHAHKDNLRNQEI